MDHFNSTVLNGTVVSTRRGFTVTKQKHKGLSFVNTSVQDVETRAKPQATKAVNSLPPATSITFVASQCQGKKGTTASQLKTTTTNKGARNSPKSDISRRRPKTQARRRSCSSSTSASTHSSMASDTARSDASNDLENGHARNLLPTPLPAWASYKLPKRPLGLARKLTFMAYALGPSKCYVPDEFRLSVEGSLRIPEELWLEKDPTSIQCATTLGVLYDTLESGRREAENLSSLTSKIFSIINRRLNAAEQNKTTNAVTIHGVSVLAMIAGYQGKYDHWQVHMKGLVRLLELVNGQDKLDARTINTIRKADFTGAISSATVPCIAFVRLHPELLVPPAVYDTAMVGAIQQHLQACALDTRTVKTISDLALFNRYMDYLTMAGNSSKHDTQTVIEEYYSLKHQLLSQPRPLRNSGEIISIDTNSNKFASDALNFATSMLIDSYATSIETVVRILALLLIRDPTLDLPCESAIMGILHQNVRAILEYRRPQQGQLANTMVDPRLLLQKSSTVHPQTPILIWICITGHYFSSLKAATTTPNQTKIYRELLVGLLGPEKAAQPEFVSDVELELCRYLSLRHLRGEGYSERGDIY
ncbi:hypothetical protein PG999_013096, partial [Apiospora kogelbergensis]